jgi:signal transduction histidine kinase/ActR/RegA family two-component response regulator
MTARPRPAGSLEAAFVEIVNAEAGIDDETTTLPEALVRMAEAEDTLRAIGTGEIDAFVVSDGGSGRRVFTLSTADRPYRMFVENMRDGAATLSASGLILYANQRLAELLSCSRAAIVGSPLAAFLTSDASSRLAEIRGPAGLGATVELDLLDGEGRPVPVLVGSSPLEVDGEHLLCLTFTDVSAQKAQEREIARLSRAEAERMADLQLAQAALAEQATRDALTERARDEADRANRAKSEFLSRMSHELRTPLNSVLGFAQLLSMDELTTEQAEHVGFIAQAGHQLLELINEVLDIARIESGQLRLLMEPVAISDVVQAAMALMRPKATQLDVVLAVRPSADQTYALADAQRLMQVLLNLLSNALKYNRPGGLAEVSWERSGGTVSVSVSDTGIGIAAPNMSKLFTPFERLGAEHTEIEGSGVGLALSRVLTQEMGGNLTGLSTIGVGSTFTLELPEAEPLAVASAVDPPRAHIAGQSPTNSVRVLYIEDNVGNVNLIERALRRRPGVELLTAVQARMGLDLAIEHQPDVILLDLHLFDLGGDEVLRRLQADPGTASIPVLMCSADASAGQIKRLLDLGAATYLTKPVDLPLLFELIEQVRRGQPINSSLSDNQAPLP